MIALPPPVALAQTTSAPEPPPREQTDAKHEKQAETNIAVAPDVGAIYLSAPDGVAAPELDVARAALLRRLQAYRGGYPGVRATSIAGPTRLLVEIRFDKIAEIPKEVRTQVLKLAALPAHNIEFRPPRDMSDAERDLFKPRAAWRREQRPPAPPLGQWFPYNEDPTSFDEEDDDAMDNTDDRFVLLHKLAVISRGDLGVPVAGNDGEWRFPVKGDCSAAKHLTSNTGLVVVMDGTAVGSTEAFLEREIPSAADPDSTQCPACEGTGVIDHFLLRIGPGGSLEKEDRPCRQCRGAGEIAKRPAAAESGAKTWLRLTADSPLLLLALLHPMPVGLAQYRGPLPLAPIVARQPAQARDSKNEPPSKDCQTWFNLAKNQLNRRDYSEAEANLRRVLELCADNPLAKKAAELLEQVRKAKEIEEGLRRR